MKKFILLASAFVFTIASAHSQFVIEKTDGSTQTVEQSISFSHDATSGDFSIGETYSSDNSIASIKAIYRKAKTPTTPPKIGDYYYSDGTWSDGGLISIDSDGLNPVWAETKPNPTEGKTVIGIVFQTNPSRMAQTDIDAGYTHGYVIATKFAHGSNKMTTWYSSDDGFDCLKSAKLASTWYTNINGREDTKTVLETYKDKMDQVPAFDWTVNDFIEAPATSSGWFLPSTGQAWDMIANLCGGEVAATMKEWQTLERDATWYCSEKVSYDVLAEINKAMAKIPDVDKEIFQREASSAFIGIYTTTPYEEESVNIINIGTDGLIELMCNWFNGDDYARPILAF